MKSTAILVIAFVSMFSVLGAGVTNEITARFPFKVLTYEGTEGSGFSSATLVIEPWTVTTNSILSDISTTLGHEHELRQVFVGHAGKKDVYRFTYVRPKNGTNTNPQITTSKEVQFDGNPVVVLKDADRTIVMSLPTEADIKLAKQR
ncbi:MAG: hypothetical protein HOP33_11050 [Verrucomicrobia bacterium]|nr:hypothetical protein [Verrucomicrobiota bacterium]